MKKIKIGRFVTKAADDKLFICHTVWPFDPFPNKIKLDGTKLAITYRKFFNIKQEVDIQVSDILNVEVTSGPLFANLKLFNRFFTDQHRTVDWLLKKDALTLKKKLDAQITELQKDQPR